jgi:hypothetical protein
MGVPAREAGDRQKGSTVKTTIIERRTTWRSLSQQDKQSRLRDLRRRHQRQVEYEILRLQQHLR